MIKQSISLRIAQKAVSKIKDDSFADLNPEKASTEEIAKWAEQYIKPVLAMILDIQGENSKDLKVFVKEDEVRIEHENKEAVQDAINSCKQYDSRFEKVSYISPINKLDLEFILQKLGIKADVYVEDQDLVVNPQDSLDNDFVDELVARWLKANNIEQISDDGESETEVIEQTEESSDDHDDVKSSEEKIEPSKDIEDWITNVIEPMVRVKLEEVGVSSEYSVEATPDGVLINLVTKEKVENQKEEELLDSIDLAYQANKPNFNLTVKLSDSVSDRAKLSMYTDKVSERLRL